MVSTSKSGQPLGILTSHTIGLPLAPLHVSTATRGDLEKRSSLDGSGSSGCIPWPSSCMRSPFDRPSDRIKSMHAIAITNRISRHVGHYFGHEINLQLGSELVLLPVSVRICRTPWAERQRGPCFIYLAVVSRSLVKYRGAYGLPVNL